MTKRIITDVNNRITERDIEQPEGNIVMSIGNETRVAFLDFIGRCSPKELAEKRLSERQRQLIFEFYHKIQ